MKTIRKIAAIVIENDEFFVVRKVGKDIWTSLGGKPEGNETNEEALLREIKEEVDCDAQIIRKLGTFSAKAVFDDAEVELRCYLVELIGTIKITDSEIEECRFISKNYKVENIKLPTSLQNQIIPFCIKEGLLKW